MMIPGWNPRDRRRGGAVTAAVVMVLLWSGRLAAEATTAEPQPPIPVRFTLDRPGLVTLVVEDAAGMRVRNLVNGEPFDAGAHTVLWDGLDIGVKQPVPRTAGVYNVVRSIVPPGEYRVRGLVRDPITLAYEFTVYPNVGDPPWPTNLQTGSGGWLADHAKPHAAVFLPADETPVDHDQVVLAATVAEAAQALAFVDLDGRKRAGRWRIGGHWTGATDMARDRGADRHPDIYLYSLMGWKQDAAKGAAAGRAAEIRIMGFTAAQIVEVARLHPELPEGWTWQDLQLGGLAVHGCLLAYSEQRAGRLYFLNTRQVTDRQPAQPIGEVAVADPRGLTFDGEGRLLVLSGRQLHRYRVKVGPGSVALSDRQVLIAAGLEDPQRVTLDDAGRLYITDWGLSHQVKVFAADGKPLRVIGHPGAPAAGPYDPLHMNHPLGVTVDSRGQVWVAEKFRTPKRVSVWTTDGTFIRAAYGPPGYGGGGHIDPADPTRFYLDQGEGGMEFAVDWSAGSAVPRRIYRLDADTPWHKPRWLGAMYPMTIAGRRYLTEDFSGPTSGHALMSIWRDDPDRARPVVLVGSVQSWPYLAEQGWLAQFPPYDPAIPAPTNDAVKRKLDRDRYFFGISTLFCWTDRNGDYTPQRDEVQFRTFRNDSHVGSFGCTTFGRDQALLLVHGKGVLRVPLQQVDGEGRPHYDLQKAEPVVSGVQIQSSSGGGQVLESSDGSFIITGGPMVGVKDNQIVWQVHSQWPSLHAGHAAPAIPEYPGQLLSTTRLLGPLIIPRRGDAGEVWAINSDKGVIYLLTADGLYLDTLGEYPRTGQRWNMPEHHRGLDLTHVNFLPEHFWPTINQTPDGHIYLVAGKEHSSVVRVDGLDSVRRLPATPMTLSPAQVRQIQDYHTARAAWERQHQPASELKVARLDRPLEIDGKVQDWPVLNWVTINTTTEQYGWGKPQQTPATVAALAVDDTHLYVALRTVHRGLLDNAGDDPQTIFRTGGALDLRLATRSPSRADPSQPAEGDLRLIVTRRDGQPFAVLYRARVPGTTQPVVFVSPMGAETIDQVSIVSDTVRLATTRQTIASTVDRQQTIPVEFHELAIPLATLGWDPATLPRTTGDIGVLLGRDGATVERTYWHNKAAGIVSDIPSETRLMPDQWGPVEVQGSSALAPR